MNLKSLKNLSAILSIVLFCAFAQPGKAASPASSALHHGGYNLGIITAGVQWYWEVNGQMPESVMDLYNSHMIPTNLVNPVTGQPLDLNPSALSPGDIKLSRIDSQTEQFTMVQPDGTQVQDNWNSSRYDFTSDSPRWTPPTQGDRAMSQYLLWVHDSLQQYYSDTGQVPQSIADLVTAGYWPFDGISNPIMGTPLQFFSDSPGNLHFSFGAKVIVRCHYSDGSSAVDSISPDCGIYLPH
jgi:hypothetical protein